MSSPLKNNSPHLVSAWVMISKQGKNKDNIGSNPNQNRIFPLIMHAISTISTSGPVGDGTEDAFLIIDRFFFFFLLQVSWVKIIIRI